MYKIWIPLKLMLAALSFNVRASETTSSFLMHMSLSLMSSQNTSHIRCKKTSILTHAYMYELVAVRSSGISKGKQKLSLTFNYDKLKVRLYQNDPSGAEDSPKIRTNEFVFLVAT